MENRELKPANENPDFGKVCSHGQLKRQCYICEIEERLAELESQIKEWILDYEGLQKELSEQKEINLKEIERHLKLDEQNLALVKVLEFVKVFFEPLHKEPIDLRRLKELIDDAEKVLGKYQPKFNPLITSEVKNDQPIP